MRRRGVAVEDCLGLDAAVVNARNLHRHIEYVGGAVVAHHQLQIREGHGFAGNLQIAELYPRGIELQAVLGQQPLEQREQVLSNGRIRRRGLRGVAQPQGHVAHVDAPGA